MEIKNLNKIFVFHVDALLPENNFCASKASAMSQEKAVSLEETKNLEKASDEGRWRFDPAPDLSLQDRDAKELEQERSVEDQQWRFTPESHPTVPQLDKEEGRLDSDENKRWRFSPVELGNTERRDEEQEQDQLLERKQDPEFGEQQFDSSETVRHRYIPKEGGANAATRNRYHGHAPNLVRQASVMDRARLHWGRVKE